MTKPFYIPFQKFQYLGGPSSFMRNLKDYLDEVNYPYTQSFWKGKGIFFPMGYRAYKLWIAKKIGMKVIQRLDGIYYPSQHGESYLKYNRLQENNYLKYSDFIIFQSEYSKKQVFSMFGEIADNKFDIIHNGADKNFFFPTAEIKKKSKFSFLTVGVFRKKAMIEPIVKALDLLKDNIDFELITIGDITDYNLQEYFQRKYLKHIGKKGKQEVAEYMRNCDALLHTQINDNCPNIIVEAVSSGLPVVGFDSGAMSELCFFSKDLLAYVSNEVFQKYEDFEYKKLADKINYLIGNYSEYKKLALEYSYLYDFRETGAKYVDVFNRILE